MCGIAGFVNVDPSRPAEQGVVRAMTDAIVHRGPDDEGFHVQGGVALGMRRLAIIDLQTGQQPISNEDGSIWVVFNGEVYNYQELREELISRGHRFKTTQLSWYARRVDGARQTLDDDYASDHRLAHLARDAGMSPFHFARVFRGLTGLPPHRYLLQRRLRAAANRLRGGASVTDACFAVGFSSLSHFIHAFRRQFGVVPSRFTAGSDTKSS